jgi:HEAT repeat protein
MHVRTILFSLVTLSPIVLAQPASPLLEQSRGIIEAALKDKNPDTRKEAVIALSLAATGEPFGSLLESALDDKDVPVRVATVASLVDLKNPGTIPALKKALNDEVPEVSFAAAKALWTLNDPEGKRALLSVVGGETKTSSGFLTRQKRDALRLLHTPKPMFLFAVRAGAGFVPFPGVGTGVSSMEGLLFDPSISGRATACLLLSKDKSADTLQALKDALSDKDWSVRASAVHSLALRDDPSLEAVLTPLLEDPKEPVRLRAAAACSRLEMIKNKPPARKRTAKKTPAKG